MKVGDFTIRGKESWEEKIPEEPLPTIPLLKWWELLYAYFLG